MHDYRLVGLFFWSLILLEVDFLYRWSKQFFYGYYESLSEVEDVAFISSLILYSLIGCLVGLSDFFLREDFLIAADAITFSM